jgi:hypothetical protein
LFKNEPVSRMHSLIEVCGECGTHRRGSYQFAVKKT